MSKQIHWLRRQMRKLFIHKKYFDRLAASHKESEEEKLSQTREEMANAMLTRSSPSIRPFVRQQAPGARGHMAPFQNTHPSPYGLELIFSVYYLGKCFKSVLRLHTMFNYHQFITSIPSFKF